MHFLIIIILSIHKTQSGLKSKKSNIIVHFFLKVLLTFFLFYDETTQELMKKNSLRRFKFFCLWSNPITCREHITHFTILQFLSHLCAVSQSILYEIFIFSAAILDSFCFHEITNKKRVRRCHQPKMQWEKKRS